MKYIRILLLSPLLIFPSLVAEENAPDPEGLAFLAGCWEMKQGPLTIYEQWSKPGGRTLLGAGRTVKGGKTMFHEFMRISEEQGKLVYSARIGTPGATPFALKTLSAGEVVFENAAHDFPQRIIYRKNGDGLAARIEGVQKGKERHEDFAYVRVACH